MNTRAKGMKLEREVESILKNQKYLTYRVKGSTKFNRNVDVFGLFDIIAKKNKKTYWIQVKSKKPPIKPFIDFKNKFCGGDERVLIYYKKNRKWNVVCVDHLYYK